MAVLYFNFTNANVTSALEQIANLAKEAEWVDCPFVSCAITADIKECTVSGSEANLKKLQEILHKEGIRGGELKSDSI
jgi:hypothetical protein